MSSWVEVPQQASQQSGVGIGLDTDKNRKVIKIYADKKTKELQQQIPSELEGYPVQIEVSEEFRAF